jgi:hypothetical protein
MTVRIDLAGTFWGEKGFEGLRVQRDEHDWVHAWIEDGVFHLACGPANLSEGLYIFRERVSS